MPTAIPAWSLPATVTAPRVPTMGQRVVFEGIHGHMHVGTVVGWHGHTLRVRMTNAYHDKPKGYVADCADTWTHPLENWNKRKGTVRPIAWDLSAPAFPIGAKLCVDAYVKDAPRGVCTVVEVPTNERHSYKLTDAAGAVHWAMEYEVTVAE